MKLIRKQLLGLHLLGIGYSGGPANGRSVALARNSTSQASSSINAALSQANQVYRHPIVYDKLTGATNNQISEVLGAKQLADYPLDHYQQQQQPSQPASPHQVNEAPSRDDFFAQLQRQAPGFPRGHPLAGHMRPMQMPPPPPTPPMPMATTQPPQRPNANAREDPLPSASSLSNNGAQQQQQQRPINLLIGQPQSQNLSQSQAQVEAPGGQPQQPVYYTPPIFAYNNFDQSQRAPADPQVSGPFGFPSQAQYPPLGLPEPPISIDEYNARQARLGQLKQLQQPHNEPQPDRYRAKAPGGQQPMYSPNLLGEPQQQQRHKQQMLDRQLLFANTPFAPEAHPNSNQSPNQNPNLNQSQIGLQQQYQDAALYRPPMMAAPEQTLRAPYAHPSADLEQQLALKQSAQNRILPPANRLEPSQQVGAQKLLVPNGQIVKSAAPNLQLGNQAPQAAQQTQLPLCARQPVEARSLELANSSAQMPSLFCNEDSEYPTKEIMRALEAYATERSIEQLLPQLLVQLHSRPEASSRNPMSDMQRQLALDSLQPSISALKPPESGQLAGFDEQRSQQQQQQVALFPSANYEPLCRSNVFMAQPRRAKNLMGQWKVVVNLPGHKYRGIAVSQMLRVDECSRPNGECATPNSPAVRREQSGLMAKSRCLQHYENQRLVAWSHQQGLHLDIFRVPVACSCHIRR